MIETVEQGTPGKLENQSHKVKKVIQEVTMINNIYEAQLVAEAFIKELQQEARNARLVREAQGKSKK